MKLIFILGCTIILTSCSKNKIEKGVTGLWSIDTIYYKNYNIKPCITNNILDLKFGKESEIPTSEDMCVSVIKKSSNPYCNIEILNSNSKDDTIPFRIKIITTNEIFAGVHKIVFYKDSNNKLLKMEIFSHGLYIICRKGLFNYDNNIDFINNLEKVSWTNRPD